MASCAASRFPNMCTLDGSRFLSESLKGSSFRIQGSVTSTKLHAGGRGSPNRRIGCLCGSFSKTSALCTFAFSLPLVNVQRRGTRHCTGVYAFFPAPGRNSRRSVPGVQSYLCLNGALVKSFGEGVFRNAGESAGSRVEATSANRGFDAESNASNEERMQSGRAATTSGSDSSRERGHEQQLPDPSEAVKPGPSLKGVGQKERVKTTPRKTLLKKRGRDVLKQLIGVQAAWPSAPLLALAREKKESEGKRRSADAPKRKPRAKRTVGLPEGDAEGVRRNENGVKGEGAMLEGGAGQQLGRAGSVESTAGSEAAAAVKIPVMLSVQSQETGTTLRGPRLKAYGDTGAQSREGPEKAGPSLTDEMARKSQKAVPLDAGEPGLEYVEEAPEGTGAAGLNGFAGNVNSDASLERVAGLEGQGAAESVNGFAQDKALRTAVVAQNRVQEQGVGRGVAPSGSRRTEAKNGVSKANGFVREDFLSRLERVQKGLGAKAEVLAREAGVVAAPDRLPATQKGQLSEAGDKVLLSLGALNDPLPPPAEGSRVGRAGNWRSRRALKGVGTRSTAAAAAARAELFGGLEMAGDGTPQEGEDAAGGAVDWGDGPLKRDANTAVAQMVASSKRFQRLRQLARDSKTGGVFPEVAEAPVESGWKPRDENSRNGVGDALGEALGLGRAAVERVVQNGTVPAKGTNEGKVSGEGLPEGLVEKEEELEFEQRGAESVELKDQLAANGQTPQTGAETTGGRMVPEERGRGNASGVEQSGPAALNGAANGAAKEAFGVSEAPTGCADRREAERDALAASTNGHATPGALVAGEKVLRNGALEGPMQSADGRSVSVMEGNGAVKKGSLPVETGAASEGSETVAVVLNGRAAGSTAALNGRASSATNGALFTERVDSGAASRNGALNGVALQSRAESERQAVNSLQSQNGAGGASGPLPKDQTEESVRSPGSDLHGSANGKILVGALNGAALLERGSSVRAEGGQNDGAVSTNGVALKSAPVLVAASGVAEDGTGARARNNLSLPEGVAIAANSRGAENGAGEGLTRETLAAVPTKHLPPPFPIKKRKSAEKMIERSKRPGGPSTGRSDSSSEGSGRRGSAPGGSEDAPVLVTASRKIGEEATEVGSAQPGGNSVPPNQPRNYTLEEDEKLFETLGLRLTGQEMSRIAEWLKSREVPELKLSRPRDRTGRYFLMPVIEAVEKHLREHGRLQSETDIGVIEPATLAETAGGVFTPGATAGPDAGENGDNFFQEMSEELSADVVLQTQELLANQDPAGGPENVRSGTPGAKKAEFLDLFDDSSDSDVESLFQRAGLSTDGRRQRRLESLEKAVIAEYLMGLNKQGADPPRREDWPCAPDGERYSKETLREVWREADEMGGLPAYLKLCRQEEAIERLLVESLSRGQPLKIGEDWREVTAEETRAVDAMHPGERAPALEFMLGLLRGGERLDWKKHRDVWPRKVRTAHLIKARLLLALVKVAQRRGGLEAYLEESRRELAKRLDSPDGLLPSTSEPYDDLLESDADSDLDDDSEEPPEVSSIRASRVARGGWREGKIDPPMPATTASATGVGWRAASFARGANSEANGPPSGGAQGGARQYEQSGGPARTLTDSLGAPTRLFSPPSKPVDRPSPVDPDPSKIPRGFPVRRPKDPVPRDPGSGFATWRVPSSEPPRQISPSRTPPPGPANSRRGGMIRSAADQSALSRLADGAFFQGGDPPQQSTPPVRESAPTRRWPSLYDAKEPPVESEGPVSPAVDSFPAYETEPTSNILDNGASRELSPIERRRRRRLLGIKLQRNEDVIGTGNDVIGRGSDDVSPGGVFEVVGRQPRSMREVLSGYSQETVLMRAEELAQPVLVEDNMRANDEEGILERLVAGHKSEMEEFKDTSKQYMRTWQDFQTWSDFFQYKNKRLPTVTDVESTCIPWLIEKAKAYVVLRKHMIKLAEGNEKLLIAMAAIQAELNKRSTASIAVEKREEYQRQTRPASKRPVKRRGRARKELVDPVAGPIIEAFDNGETF